MKVLVSACLLGENCKYNGKNNRNEAVLRFVEVKWISQSVGDHHCLCLFRPGRFQHGYINIILRNGYIHEYRNGAVLNSRSHGGRKAAGYGDDLIPTFDAALSKQRRGQGHKGKKIGR